MTIDPITILSERVVAAVRAAFPNVEGEIDPLVAINKNQAMGDYQSNVAMGLSRRVGKPPREVAIAVVSSLRAGDLCEEVSAANVAGPGFINLKLRDDAIARMVQELERAPAHAGSRGTIVVDLCGVNLAKEMHVGHLRSTIIGDALARTYERLGYRVIRQNHLGDWGLPIAMVTGKVMGESTAGRIDLATITLADLDRIYRAAQKECNVESACVQVILKHNLGAKIEAECEEEFTRVDAARERLASAKQTLVRLQSGDRATVRVWERIVEVTIAACAENCRRLHAIVLPEHTAGESSFAQELGAVVEDLLARSVAEVDQGAVVVRLDRPEWGDIKEPAIIRKSDGGFLYATTDIAAIRRRVQGFGADRVVYCVDARQALHFKQVFAAAIKAGYATRAGASAPALLQHAAFGTILGEDGTPFKTRSGDNVKLADLITEACERARGEMGKRLGGGGGDIVPETMERTAWAVGVAAIKYADLSIERIKDYVFSFDRMVAFEGNTGPYLLYAYARIRNIFRKGEAAGVGMGVGEAWRSSPIRVNEPAERALALALVRYGAALEAVGASAEPHRLCQYLYELAGAFSSFYASCRVLDAEGGGEGNGAAVRDSRLRLCDVTCRVLADGLTCLGIPLVERM